MLWYKAWLDTRIRFFVGLLLLIVSAVAIVASYPRVVALLATVPVQPLGGRLGEAIAESAALASTYRGYIWSQWMVKNLPQLWCLFAVILGTGGLVSQSSRQGALFSLSLPVSRQALVLTRTAMVTAELFVLALVPPLLVPALSPAVGQSYALSDALVHGVCVFVGGLSVVGITILASSVFTDVWRPVLLVLGAAIVLGIAAEASPAVRHYSLQTVMGGESYFEGNGLPWIGMTVSVAVAALAVWAAVVQVSRRDF